LAGAQRQHLRVSGRPLDAAVPGAVVVAAVPVSLPVGHIVLVVVGDEVGKREAVVRGDKVDAGVGTTSTRFVEVRASGEAGAELRQGLVLTPPPVAHAIPILAVPLRPQSWEVAHLVPA